MSVMDDAYAGQKIFLTGATGFVGKVLVEKVLRSLPVVEKLYVFVRPKKDVDPAERLITEIRESKAMDRLREVHGEKGFNEMWQRKVVPVTGGLTERNLGMTDEAYANLVKEVTMIIHLAATINFDEKLDLSTKLNILGSLQILSLARKCHNRGGFEGFVHMSTCYVNYPRHGGQRIEEVLYPLSFDPEVVTKQILNYDPATLEKLTPAILKKHGFPNTYTMTKSMSEHLLNTNRGNVPIAIVRPAIIGCSLEEPKPGWVDTLSASGALFLTSGLGIVREVHASPDCKADIVPVDYVVKGTLLAGARLIRETRSDLAASAEAPAVAPQNNGSLPLTAGNLERAANKTRPLEIQVVVPSSQQADIETKSTTTIVSTVDRAQRAMPIYQLCTSGTDNALLWGDVQRYVVRHWQQHPPKQQFRPCKVQLIKSRAEFEGKFHVKRKLPAMLYSAQANLPFPGARPEAEKQAQKLSKVTSRAYDLVSQFRAFTNFSWDFMPVNSQQLLENLPAAELAAWNMDNHNISWHVYLALYCWGIMTNVLKEEAEFPNANHVSGALLYAQSNL